MNEKSAFVCVVVGAKKGLIAVRINPSTLVIVLKNDIKDREGLLIPCPPGQLRLFFAAKNGTWLGRDDPMTEALVAGEWTTEMEGMVCRRELQDLDTLAECMEEDGLDAPSATPRELHILVMLPEEREILPGYPISWSEIRDPGPPLTFDAKNSIIRVPRTYLEGTGLSCGDDGVVLFPRKEMIKQLCAMRSQALSNMGIAWIVGPQGTGKSCAALVLAFLIDRCVGYDLGECIKKRDNALCVAHEQWQTRLSRRKCRKPATRRTDHNSDKENGDVSRRLYGEAQAVETSVRAIV